MVLGTTSFGPTVVTEGLGFGVEEVTRRLDEVVDADAVGEAGLALE